MARRVVTLALLAAILLAGLAHPARAQVTAPAAPPAPSTPLAARDVASYDLTARWQPQTSQIQGSATITYTNLSTDTLGEIWLKLYLNAFRSESTQWMQESNGAHRGNGWDPDHPGWIWLQSLRLADTGEDVLPPDANIGSTVLRVPLPAARATRPGEQVRLAVTWTSQLPQVFARTGVAGDFVMAGQWYPKLAVYHQGQWDTEPWHANSEFFHDFGDYTLDLTVPSGYVTGASGLRESTVANADGTSTVRYRAESVTDVAWTAWPRYRQAARTVMAAGQRIELELLAPRDLPLATDERYFGSAQAALDRLGGWYGAYPWPKLTLVVPPADAEGAGGMEYPSLVTLELPTDLPFGLGSGIHEVEVVTIHEIAHEWVPMQLATDEGREAWLDEGFADYATIRVLRTLFPDDATMVQLGPFWVSYETIHRVQFALVAVHQPLAQPSWLYPDMLTYGATVYSKGVVMLETLERYHGEQRFLAAMRGYFDRWRWGHPTTADFQRALEDGLGEPLGWFFQPLVYGQGVVEYTAEATPGGGIGVVRRGDVAFPVVIEEHYPSGQVERQPWDGAATRIDLTGEDGPPTRAEVDPDQVVRLEPDVLDNGIDTRPSRLPLALLAARILAVLQTVLVLAGAVG
jgi:hypothetical protein